MARSSFYGWRHGRARRWRQAEDSLEQTASVMGSGVSMMGGVSWEDRLSASFLLLRSPLHCILEGRNGERAGCHGVEPWPVDGEASEEVAGERIRW